MSIKKLRLFVVSSGFEDEISSSTLTTKQGSKSACPTNPRIAPVNSEGDARLRGTGRLEFTVLPPKWGRILSGDLR